MSTTSKKRKRNRLGKCDICRSVDAKYTCPRCEAVTCSLDCVKKHKSELDCDGVRVKTKFVPVNQMNECTFLSDYRLLEEVARCVEEAEWKRESLETPQQVVLDIQDEDPEIINRDPAKIPVDTKEAKEPTVAVSEKYVGETEPPPEDSKKKPKKRQRKRKSKNPTLSDPVSKADVLIAKAERIRQKILNGRKSKLAGIVDEKEIVTKLPEEASGIANGVNQCDAGNEDANIAVPDDNTDPDVDYNRNSSSSSQESSDSNNSSSSSPDEGDDIEEEIEGEEDQLPDELPLCASSDETTPPNERNEEEVREIGQEMQMNDSVCIVEKRKLSNEELIQIKKEKLRASVALGGTKKTMTMECLANAAFSRGIHLTTLPEKFEKHWENSSFFVSNEDCIYWRLKVSFINANFYTLSLNECPETITLESVITGCLQQSKQFYEGHGKDDPLVVYRSIDFSKISVLMAADKLPNNQKKFYILDPKKTLRENFRGKCIVEFPHLCVAIEDCFVVSQVQEKMTLDFFHAESYDESKENPELSNEFERKWKKSANRERRKKKEDGYLKHISQDSDSDRESGELTDSSDSSSDSDEELFEESEFRSIYKDLLTTFDIDINQLQNK